MSAVTTTSASGNSLAALLSAGTPSVPPRSDPPASAASNASAGEDRGPATSVELSDKVKAVLAKAKTDQSVADQLQAFVKHRHQGGSSQQAKSDSSQPADSGSKADIDKVFQKLTAGNSAQDSAPIDPAISFQNGVQAGDVSVSVTTAETGTVTTIVNGPGWSYSDTKFGGSNLEVITRASFQTGEYDITYSQTDAAAASVTSSSDSGAVSASAAVVRSTPVTFGWTSPTGAFATTINLTDAAAVSVTASSGAGVTSASAAEVHSSSVTFATNFKTGSFSIVQSETTASSRTARIGQPTSSFSRIV